EKLGLDGACPGFRARSRHELVEFDRTGAGVGGDQALGAAQADGAAAGLKDDCAVHRTTSMLPPPVEARSWLWHSFTSTLPPPVDTRAPVEESIWMLPPPVSALTRPALPAMRMAPPPVRRFSSPGVLVTSTLPPPVSALIAPPMSASCTLPPPLSASTRPARLRTDMLPPSVESRASSSSRGTWMLNSAENLRGLPPSQSPSTSATIPRVRAVTRNACRARRASLSEYI